MLPGPPLSVAAAQIALANAPLRDFLHSPVIPYETDEVTRLIFDTHDESAFAPIASLTVGEFRDWLLGPSATADLLAAIAPGVIPEMAAAVSKLMRIQDLIAVASRIRRCDSISDHGGSCRPIVGLAFSQTILRTIRKAFWRP